MVDRACKWLTHRLSYSTTVLESAKQGSQELCTTGKTVECSDDVGRDNVDVWRIAYNEDCGRWSTGASEIPTAMECGTKDMLKGDIAGRKEGMAVAGKRHHSKKFGAAMRQAVPDAQSSAPAAHFALIRWQLHRGRGEAVERSEQFGNRACPPICYRSSSGLQSVDGCGRGPTSKCVVSSTRVYKRPPRPINSIVVMYIVLHQKRET